MKVLIIGAGNMGRTYAESFINASVISRDNLFFLEKNEAKAAELLHLTHNPLHTEASSFMRSMDIVILSVKPQDFPGLSDSLAAYLTPGQLVLSIMAGIKVQTIREETFARKVIRAMPNLPAQLGMGMTVFTASADVTPVEVFSVQNLLNTTGKTIYTPSERLIDAATAISGSGPAFVFFFMNAMIEAAKEFGFSDSEAQMLVEQTFMGSVHLLHKDSLSCREWIQKVASKGGTTEAALSFYGKNAFSDLLKGGLEAAFKRAEELSLKDIQ
jgi:pyrroline-5-carboxylate reductase